MAIFNISHHRLNYSIEYCFVSNTIFILLSNVLHVLWSYRKFLILFFLVWRVKSIHTFVILRRTFTLADKVQNTIVYFNLSDSLLATFLSSRELNSKKISATQQWHVSRKYNFFFVLFENATQKYKQILALS